MYSVLLLDDLPQVRISLKDKLMHRSMNVYPCRTVYEAQDIWNEKKVDAIVMDMMMPSLGLDNDLRYMTKGGLLTGWIWLWRALNPNQEEIHPTADKCIIFYSAYLEDFKAYIDGNQPSRAEKEYYKLIKSIPKGNSNLENEVVEYLFNDMQSKTHYHE